MGWPGGWPGGSHVKVGLDGMGRVGPGGRREEEGGSQGGLGYEVVAWLAVTCPPLGAPSSTPDLSLAWRSIGCCSREHFWAAKWWGNEGTPHSPQARPFGARSTCRRLLPPRGAASASQHLCVRRVAAPYAFLHPQPQRQLCPPRTFGAATPGQEPRMSAQASVPTCTAPMRMRATTTPSRRRRRSCGGG